MTPERLIPAYRGAFFDAYVECALWASHDDDGAPLDASYSGSDITTAALASMAADCEAFAAANATDLAGVIDAAQAGHDFWLTRNRHGAGFWDRGLGAVGDRLTDAAHAYGECGLYVGDDGHIYVSPA